MVKVQRQVIQSRNAVLHGYNIFLLAMKKKQLAPRTDGQTFSGYRSSELNEVVHECKSVRIAEKENYIALLMLFPFIA